MLEPAISEQSYRLRSSISCDALQTSLDTLTACTREHCRMRWIPGDVVDAAARMTRQAFQGLLVITMPNVDHRVCANIDEAK